VAFFTPNNTMAPNQPQYTRAGQRPCTRMYPHGTLQRSLQGNPRAWRGLRCAHISGGKCTGVLITEISCFGVRSWLLPLLVPSPRNQTAAVPRLVSQRTEPSALPTGAGTHRTCAVGLAMTAPKAEPGCKEQSSACGDRDREHGVTDPGERVTERNIYLNTAPAHLWGEVERFTVIGNKGMASSINICNEVRFACTHVGMCASAGAHPFMRPCVSVAVRVSWRARARA
jgi:hypothetical protein